VLLELVDLVVRLRLERLALVERQRAREVVAPLGHDGGNALHRLGALEGGTPCPPAPGGVRRRNRALGISTRAFGNSAEALPRRRARRARALAGLPVDPLARDEHAVLHRRSVASVIRSRTSGAPSAFCRLCERSVRRRLPAFK